MKKVVTILAMFVIISTLSACQSTPITCGEGTIIKDGQCVAPDKEIIEDQVEELSCDDISGTLFQDFDFNQLDSNDQFVDNEVGNEHNANNFVIWGKNENGQLLDDAYVDTDVLNVSNLDGDQFDHYYDTGLGYQYMQFEDNVTYTVCTIVEGPAGQTVTSEFGIYYGFGIKDDVLLTGEKQMIIQNVRLTSSTNTDRGQYVLFTGKINGDIAIYDIKITKSN